jgi:hypothetical protein
VQVAVTFDGTVGTAAATHVYVNGVEQSKTTAFDGTGTINFTGATNQPFRIGASTIDLAASLNGKMAYLAVYKGRILTPAEIASLDQQLPIKHLAGVSAIVSPGAPQTVSSGTAGQTLNVDFSGSAGQPAVLSFSNNTMGAVTVAVLNPDQSTLATTSSAAASFSLPQLTLPQTGNYTISITSGQPGSITVNLALGVVPGRPWPSVIDGSNPLAANLVGLFLMNEGSGSTDLNVVDGQVATASGTAPPTTWNALDPSLVFNGGSNQGSFLNAGNDLAFDRLTPGQMTIVSKIFVPVLNSSGGIAEKNDGSPNGGSGFTFNFSSTGSLHFVVSKSSAALSVQTSPALPSGQWVQVAVTFDGTVGTAAATHVYVNGVEQSKTTAFDGSGTINFTGATNQPFRIGASTIDLAASLNGKMAYLAIYKGRVLTPAEINALDQQLPIKQTGVPLSVEFLAPAPNTAVNSHVNVSAVVSTEAQRVDFTLGGQTISSVLPPFQATFNLSGVAEGPQTITATAVGFDATTASAQLPILVDHTLPATPDGTRIFAEPPVGGSSHVHGLAGSVVPPVLVEITDTTDGLRSTVIAGGDGSFTTNLAAQQGDTVSIVAIDEAGNRSLAAVVAVLSSPSPFARLVIPWEPASPFSFSQSGSLVAFHRVGCGASGSLTEEFCLLDMPSLNTRSFVFHGVPDLWQRQPLLNTD